MSDTPVMDEAGLAQPLAQLRSVLIPGETLEAYAIQMRLFALLHRRLLVAATSGRLIVLGRKKKPLANGPEPSNDRLSGKRRRREKQKRKRSPSVTDPPP